VNPARTWLRRGLLPLVIAGSLGLAGCGGTSDVAEPTPDATDETPAEVAEAASGDPLVIYSGRSEQLMAPLFEQFTAETGIPVSARYGDTAELAAQLLEEGDRTPAQVYFAQDAGALGAIDAEGLFADLPPGIASIVPPQFQSADGTWTGVTGRARVIAYDSEQVPAEDVPTSVFDLTDPKWKGQVAIAPTNASFQSFVTAMRLSQGDDVTREWLAGLVANDVQRFEKNGQILEAVNAGQVQLGLINNYYWYLLAKEVGESNMRAQIAFTEPKDPGTLVNIAGVGILKPAAENVSAVTFVEWLLTDAVQQWFVENTFEYPLVPSVAAADGLPELETLSGPDVALADLADLPGTLAMLEEVGLL
jgi:iron(III) transport system substrate-binding protein